MNGKMGDYILNWWKDLNALGLVLLSQKENELFQGECVVWELGSKEISSPLFESYKIKYEIKIKGDNEYITRMFKVPKVASRTLFI